MDKIQAEKSMPTLCVGQYIVVYRVNMLDNHLTGP